eukprot:gene25729-33600_t
MRAGGMFIHKRTHQIKGNTTSKQIDDIFTRHGNTHLKHVAPIILLRGGSTGTIERKDSTIVSSLSVVVSTSFGSSFLDKKKKFTLASNSTIFDLKEQIASKFPGSPPVEIQQLYFSSRHLNDDSELVSNISSMQPVPILLDVISGNSVYNRTLSVRQSLEAYVSTVVQQSFIGKKLNSLYSRSLSPVEAVSTIQMEAIAFRSMFHELNDTLYTSYGEEIRAALQAERDPETTAADTAAWRDPNRKKASPLTAALAKEFDLNVRGLVNFLYYSLVLMFFACFGTTGSSLSLPLLAIVPLMWVSKLRQLRLLAKIALYLVLPSLSKMDFVLPILPATWQTIAKESVKWPADSDSAEAVSEAGNGQSPEGEAK